MVDLGGCNDSAKPRHTRLKTNIFDLHMLNDEV